MHVRGYDHNHIETTIIDCQIINKSCKRNAIEDIFVRPKEIQQIPNCSKFNEIDISIYGTYVFTKTKTPIMY